MNKPAIIQRRVLASRSAMPLHHPPYFDEWQNPDCGLYSFLCQANPEGIRWALSPLPFEPFGNLIQVAIFDQSGHTYGGYETGIAIPVRYGRRPGLCFVHHYVTSDIAVIAGREFFGYPKLIGDVNFRRRGGRFNCTTHRRGHHLLTMSGRVTRKSGPDLAEWFPGFPRGSALFGQLLQVKAFPRADRTGAALRQVVYRDLNVKTRRIAVIDEPQVTLGGSPDDPVERFGPLKVLAATFTELSYGGGWKVEKRRVLADLTREGP